MGEASCRGRATGDAGPVHLCHAAAICREKVMREPSSVLEGFTLLSETIRNWDAETDEWRLERQFLLKELCIVRRNEHLPSWSGAVTQTRAQQVMPPKTDKVCERVCVCVCVCVIVTKHSPES
jgi:hypothetical protein